MQLGQARLAHGLQGSRAAGHQLELAGRLVQEEVEAADHGGPGLPGGLGQAGRPGSVDHVEHAGRDRDARHAAFDKKISGTGRQGGDEQIRWRQHTGTLVSQGLEGDLNPQAFGDR